MATLVLETQQTKHVALPSSRRHSLPASCSGRKLRQRGKVTFQGPVERTGGEGRPSGSGLAVSFPCLPPGGLNV